MLTVNLKSVGLIQDKEKNLQPGSSNHNLLLNNIRIDLPPGRVFTILGNNGSGKTTLIKALTKLLDPRFYFIDGEVKLDNTNILSADTDTLLEIRKKKIKYVFQDAINSFDPLKTFSYYFEKFSDNKSEISELFHYFILPEYEKIIKLHSYEVSGGMAQRISFILALLAHPKLIILDEPTSGIDYPIGNLFILKLKEFVTNTDNSVLLVTQDLQFAKKVSDQIALLNDKMLSEFQSTEEFFINI